MKLNLKFRQVILYLCLYESKNCSIAKIEIKNVFILLFLIYNFTNAKTQVKIGDLTLPHSSSLLDLSLANSNKGLLLPRDSLSLKTFHRSTSSKNMETAVGLMVYNTMVDTINSFFEGPYVWNGNQWHAVFSIINSFVSVKCDSNILRCRFRYRFPPCLRVVVENIGSQPINKLQIFSSTLDFNVIPNTLITLPVGEILSFTVFPKFNLPVGIFFTIISIKSIDANLNYDFSVFLEVY